MKIEINHGEEIMVSVAGTDISFLIALYEDAITIDRCIGARPEGELIELVNVPIEPSSTALEEYSPVSFGGNTADQEEPLPEREVTFEWIDSNDMPRKSRISKEPVAPTQLTEQARAAAAKAKAEVIEAARAKLEYMTKKDFRKSWNDHPWFALRHVFKDETASWISGEMWFIHDRLEIQRAMEARGYTGVTTFSMDHGSDAAGPRFTRIALAFDKNDVLTYFYYD